MLGGMNPKAMKAAMKKMGVKETPIEATEVIIKTPGKDLIVRNPSVAVIEMMGQESIQIQGEIEVYESGPSEEDVETVMAQADCSKEKAKEALLKHDGDLAEAILEIQGSEEEGQ